jgi:hypothetical protein
MRQRPERHRAAFDGYMKIWSWLFPCSEPTAQASSIFDARYMRDSGRGFLAIPYVSIWNLIGAAIARLVLGVI